MRRKERFIPKDMIYDEVEIRAKQEKEQNSKWCLSNKKFKKKGKKTTIMSLVKKKKKKEKTKRETSLL